MLDYYDIKPYSEIATITEERTGGIFEIADVLPVVGMAESFVKKIIGNSKQLTEEMVLRLLEQDAFSETFVPRSKVLTYLRNISHVAKSDLSVSIKPNSLYKGDAGELISRIENNSIQCVVTSTPYWAMRVYDEMTEQDWADGEHCAFGLEQTPEAFIRHSVEILYKLLPKITDTGSVWWNIMDSYNTRTQIRSNAAEALMAMKGRDNRSWKDHQYKRYSHGHAYLKDGEQCLIPQRIAERASRIGYYVKSTISWCKTATLPEPQLSRVSRNIEYVLHLTKHRTPIFHKEQYLKLPPNLGGKQPFESEKLSDFWYLPTSSGRDGHGAQFPIQLPGRCIALSTSNDDIVLDPFIGSGNTALAAILLDRRYIGFDISEEYIKTARDKVNNRATQISLSNIL
jgi:DNA modification methylase